MQLTPKALAAAEIKLTAADSCIHGNGLSEHRGFFGRGMVRPPGSLSSRMSCSNPSSFCCGMSAGSVSFEEGLFLRVIAGASRMPDGTNNCFLPVCSLYRVEFTTANQRPCDTASLGPPGNVPCVVDSSWE